MPLFKKKKQEEDRPWLVFSVRGTGSYVTKVLIAATPSRKEAKEARDAAMKRGTITSVLNNKGKPDYLK